MRSLPATGPQIGIDTLEVSAYRVPTDEPESDARAARRGRAPPPRRLSAVRSTPRARPAPAPEPTLPLRAPRSRAGSGRLAPAQRPSQRATSRAIFAARPAPTAAAAP